MNVARLVGALVLLFAVASCGDEAAKKPWWASMELREGLAEGTWQVDRALRANETMFETIAYVLVKPLANHPTDDMEKVGGEFWLVKTGEGYPFPFADAGGIYVYKWRLLQGDAAVDTCPKLTEKYTNTVKNGLVLPKLFKIYTVQRPLNDLAGCK